jgi:hypothetical protein
MLAARLTEHWEGRAKFRLEPLGFGSDESIWVVRSDMVNGLPREKRA